MSAKHRSHLVTYLIIWFGVALVATASPTLAGDISLAWDSVADTDLDGYRVEWGAAPGIYSFQQDLLAGSTEVTIPGLADCTDWFVAVRAFDTAGNFSLSFSNEVSGWARPTVAAASPAAAARGQQLDVTVSGTNFKNGATVAFGDPAITVNLVTVVSCTEITVGVTVGNLAAVGTTSLSVTNLDQTFGTVTGAFSVTAPDTTLPILSAVSVGTPGSTSAQITWTTDEPADSQAFYRVQGTTTFLSTERDTALVTAHAVLVQGLNPSTIYDFHVRSADNAANVATSTDGVFTTLASTLVYLRFEAEAGALVAPVRATAGSGAFGDAWIDTAVGTPGGTVFSPSGTSTHGVNVPTAGTWHLWVRMFGPDFATNSFHESVDGGPRQAVIVDRVGEWRWMAGRAYTLSAGEHVVELGGRAAQARVDRVLLTNDPNFVPTEQPVNDTTPPAAPSSASATPTDSVISLAWTNPADTDLARVVVRYRAGGVAPTSPVDGAGLVDRAATPGAADSALHTGLTNGGIVTYSIFALDSSGNVSAATQVTGIPVDNVPPAAVINLRRSDVVTGP